MTNHRNTEESSGSTSDMRKFTLSCSRCRAAKLKCDRQEPCMECVKRNVGDLCTKDKRQPRSKRVKTNNSNHGNKSKSPESREAEVEEVAEILDHFVDVTSHTIADLSVIFNRTLPCVAPDFSNPYWSITDNLQRQEEKLTLISDIVDAMPELDVLRLLCDVFVTRCASPLGNVVHTPTYIKQAEQFYDCLQFSSREEKVMALSTGVAMDTLACHLLVLVLALAFHPSPSILNWSPTLLALRVEELRGSEKHSQLWRTLALACLKGEASLFCGSIMSLQAAVMLLLDGQQEPLALDGILVTAISGARNLGLHRLGDARLEVSPISPSSARDGSSMSTEFPFVRTEVGIRIWWALVMRDWSRGQTLAYYNVHPSQFNTRKPLHINDDDLMPLTANIHGYVVERPRSEFTMLSYTVFTLEIVTLLRESIDLRSLKGSVQQRQEPDKKSKVQTYYSTKYEELFAKLPPYFKVGSTEGLNSAGPMAAIPVQRWMLHQQLWSLFLRLCRVGLLPGTCCTSYQLQAQNIINTQALIQLRCTVCGSLSIGDIQLFNAAMALLIDLLSSPKSRDSDRSSTAELSRLMTRDKINEAIGLLRTRCDVADYDMKSSRIKNSAQRSIIILEALMKLEEEEHSGNEQNKGRGSDRAAKRPLKNKIIDILEATQRKDRNAALEASPNLLSLLEVPVPFPSVTEGFPDLDLLPTLSNEAGYSASEFLDFALPVTPGNNHSLPMPEDFHTLNSATPFTPCSSETHVWSNFNGTESTDS